MSTANAPAAKGLLAVRRNGVWSLERQQGVVRNAEGMAAEIETLKERQRQFLEAMLGTSAWRAAIRKAFGIRDESAKVLALLLRLDMVDYDILTLALDYHHGGARDWQYYEKLVNGLRDKLHPVAIAGGLRGGLRITDVDKQRLSTALERAGAA